MGSTQPGHWISQHVSPVPRRCLPNARRQGISTAGGAHKMPTVQYHMDGQTYRLADYLRRQDVTGLLILKDGRVVYEYYGSGNSAATLWTSRSVAKSVVSILVGMAVKEGLIGSVDDPITPIRPNSKQCLGRRAIARSLAAHLGRRLERRLRRPHLGFRTSHPVRGESRTVSVRLGIGQCTKRRPGVRPGEGCGPITPAAHRWLVGHWRRRPG